MVIKNTASTRQGCFNVCFSKRNRILTECYELLLFCKDKYMLRFVCLCASVMKNN